MSDSEVKKNWCFVTSTGSLDLESDSRSSDDSTGTQTEKENVGAHSTGFQYTEEATNDVKRDSDIESSSSSDVDVIEENDDTFLKMTYSQSPEDLVICPPGCFERELVLVPPTTNSIDASCQTEINMGEGLCAWMIFSPAAQWLIKQLAVLLFMTFVALSCALISYSIMDGSYYPMEHKDLMHNFLECLGEQHLEALISNDAELLHARICKDKTGKYRPKFDRLTQGTFKFTDRGMQVYSAGNDDDIKQLNKHLTLLQLQLHYFGMLPVEPVPLDDYVLIKEMREMHTTEYLKEQKFLHILSNGIRNLSEFDITENVDNETEAAAKSVNQPIRIYKAKQRFEVLRNMSSVVKDYQSHISATYSDIRSESDAADGLHLKNIQEALENLTSVNQKLLKEIHSNIVLNQNLPNQVSSSDHYKEFKEIYEGENQELKDGILSLFLENEKMKKQLKNDHQDSKPNDEIPRNNQLHNDICSRYERIIPDSLIAILNLTRKIAFLQGSVNNDINEVKEFVRNFTDFFNWKQDQQKSKGIWNNLRSNLRHYFSLDQQKNASEIAEQTSDGSWQRMYSWQGMINLWQDLQNNLTENISKFEKGKMAETINTYVEGTKKTAEHMLNKVNDYIISAQNKTMEILAQSLEKSDDSSSVKTVWKFLGNLKESLTHMTGEMKNAATKIFDPTASCSKSTKKNQAKIRTQRSDWLFERAAIRAKWRERQHTNNWYLELMKIRKKLRDEKQEQGI